MAKLIYARSLVEKLKQGLPVTQNQVWKQTSALSEDDLKEQANCIERLMTDKVQLSAQVQRLEKQLQKIKNNNEILQIDKENLERDIFSMNTRNERLEQELRAAKAKGNGLLQVELDRYKAANESLVIERDKHYRRTVELDNQVRELKRQPDKLRAEITRLKHLEHDCQAIKANGERCDKPAKGKVEFHGVLINVCLQHQNQLMKAS